MMTKKSCIKYLYIFLFFLLSRKRRVTRVKGREKEWKADGKIFDTTSAIILFLVWLLGASLVAMSRVLTTVLHPSGIPSTTSTNNSNLWLVGARIGLTVRTSMWLLNAYSCSIAFDFVHCTMSKSVFFSLLSAIVELNMKHNNNFTSFGKLQFRLNFKHTHSSSYQRT